MIDTCPRCGAGAQEGRAECSGCGVIFAKLRPREEEAGEISRPPAPMWVEEEQESFVARVARLCFHVEPDVNPLAFGGRAVLYVVFFLWGLHFIRLPAESEEFAESFMHVINLVFHEAGHVVLMPFGWDFLVSLGGSLVQVVIPLICGGALLLQARDPFGASLGLWWAGQSLMDLGPYIGDARALQIMLLGGYTGAEVEGHDWEAILGALGLLHWDNRLAVLAHLLGSIMILTALAWGGYVLWLQRRQMTAGSR